MGRGGRHGRTAPAGRRAPIDSKRVARENRLARQRRATRIRVAAVIILVATVLVSSIALYRSTAFTIERIDVVGAARLTDDQVRALVALPEGSTLLRYPRAEIEERLVASPWIAEAQVSRDFPDGLRVRVVEREPVVLVDVGDALFWLVDREGTVLEQRTPDATDTMVIVRDLVEFEPIEGEVATSAALLNALKVLAGLSADLRGDVRAISAQSVDLTTLITNEDVEILVGSADDIARKDVVARGILEEQSGAVVYINVRTADRPTWRGLDLP